jgi:hypothetical protein
MKKVNSITAIVLGSLKHICWNNVNTNPVSKSVVVLMNLQIKIEELPAVVTEALKKAYPDANYQKRM